MTEGQVAGLAQLGKLAGLISLLGFVPYVRSILRGQTRPQRVSWGLWALLDVTLLLTHLQAGGIRSMWVPLSQAAGSLSIALLSLSRGVGGWSMLDRLCLAGSLAGLLLWRLSSATVGLCASILVHFIAGVPTLSKAYVDPDSEDLTTWLCFLCGNTLNLAAITRWSAAEAIYPIYLFLGTTMLVAVVLTRRRWGKHGRRAQSADR